MVTEPFQRAEMKCSEEDHIMDPCQAVAPHWSVCRTHLGKDGATNFSSTKPLPRLRVCEKQRAD